MEKPKKEPVEIVQLRFNQWKAGKISSETFLICIAPVVGPDKPVDESAKVKESLDSFKWIVNRAKREVLEDLKEKFVFVHGDLDKHQILDEINRRLKELEE